MTLCGSQAPSERSAGAAEVVGGAAERERQAERREPLEHEVEPVAVLEREAARQDVLVGVVVVQAALHADQGLGVRPEHGDRLTQLIGLGSVLGAEDHDELALREREADVAGLRLGAGMAVRHDDDANELGHAGGEGRIVGLGVDLLEQQQHLEPVLRVVEPAEVLGELHHDVGLAQCRHEHAVDRQLAVGNLAARLGLATGRPAHAQEAARDGDALEADIQRDCDVRQHEERRERGERLEHGAAGERQRERGEHGGLRPRDHATRRVGRSALRERARGAAGELGAVGLQQRSAQVPLRRGLHLDRARPSRGGADLLLESRRRLLGRRHDHGPPLAADRDPARLCQILGVEPDPLDQARIGWHRPQVAERHAPQVRQALVDVEAPDDPPRREQLTEPGAAPPCLRERLGVPGGRRERRRREMIYRDGDHMGAKGAGPRPLRGAL
jgi:hypothetical protein